MSVTLNLDKYLPDCLSAFIVRTTHLVVTSLLNHIRNSNNVCFCGLKCCTFVHRHIETGIKINFSHWCVIHWNTVVPHWYTHRDIITFTTFSVYEFGLMWISRKLWYFFSTLAIRCRGSCIPSFQNVNYPTIPCASTTHNFLVFPSNWNKIFTYKYIERQPERQLFSIWENMA